MLALQEGFGLLGKRRKMSNPSTSEIDEELQKCVMKLNEPLSCGHRERVQHLHESPFITAAQCCLYTEQECVWLWYIQYISDTLNVMIYLRLGQNMKTFKEG